MKNLSEAKKEVLKAKSIAVFCHINPDGDTIGSMLGLGLGLEALGKQVSYISFDEVPQVYKVLPGAKKIRKTLKKTPDLAIALDCGTSKLLGEGYKYFKKAKSTMTVDHHKIREPFAKVKLIDSKAAAVGELVYLLLNTLKVNIDDKIAENILTSIIVETNSFRLPTVNPLTFKVCARLLETGVDFHKLSNCVYWSKSRESAMLGSICMMRTKYLENGKIIWSIVKEKDFKTFNANDQDLDAFANDMLSIKGVEVSIFFRERANNSLRVSLRSKGKANVAKLAEEFSGGGHLDSAGCFIKNSKKDINKVLFAARKALKQGDL